ncbi:hypothetical protein OZ411_01240 [Bradyrhizobium sp. Arg237L]|uniref:phage head-tail joining protein n=1 Tax=Bradyrhizobium sp. Arg237L TaxID=3003352 RepID=UPI00249F15BA|nr:hypothetical protein [Bradyrhizobium sp. Arg237L]MDI4231437.1 hypothetical protein [Bradyrhizobium sp. Arg237L]
MAALTQADVDRLKKAIAKGVQRVEYDSGAVTYQSIDQMLKALAFAEADLAGTSSTRNTPSTLAVFGRD